MNKTALPKTWLAAASHTAIAMAVVVGFILFLPGFALGTDLRQSKRAMTDVDEFDASKEPILEQNRGNSSASGQAFSAAEKNEFSSQEVPAIAELIQKWFQDRNWLGSWSRSRALNRNKLRVNLPDRLEMQYALDLGTGTETSNTHSGGTIVFQVAKYRSEALAELAMQNLQENYILKLEKDRNNKNIVAVPLKLSNDSKMIRHTRTLGRTSYGRFRIMLSFGNYTIRLDESPESEINQKRYSGLTKAVIHALEQRGVSDKVSSTSGNTIAANSDREVGRTPVRNSQKALSSDVVSGIRLGYSPPGNSSKELKSKFSPTNARQSMGRDTSHAHRAFEQLQNVVIAHDAKAVSK